MENTWLASLFLNSYLKSHLLTKIFPSFPIKNRCSLFPLSVPLTPFPVLISPLHFPLPTVISPVAYPFMPVFTQLDWRHFVPHIDLPFIPTELPRKCQALSKHMLNGWFHLLPLCFSIYVSAVLGQI